MRKYFLIFSMLFLFIQPSMIFAAKPDSDEELWKHLQRRSEVYWEEYARSRGVVDAGEWKSIIETAFIRLAQSSGESSFRIKYAVVNDRRFNASAYPGGQFIINSGTLSDFDSLIYQQTSGRKLSAAEMAVYRENWIAPLIAHELGHYYNRHFFKLLKKQMNFDKNSKDSIDMMTIKYVQENEFDADRTGFFLLKKAGYDPVLEIVLLELLNMKTQETLKEGGVYNNYIDSHPSPHERLAVFNTNRTEWHKWAAQMEFAFSGVQSGKDLTNAITTIESAIEKYPENIYFKKAIAVAYHKQWLATVPLKEQKLKGIITMQSFRDEMVYSTRGSKGIKAVPGNKAFYAKAKAAYEKVQGQAVDYPFNSNYALLLCYSPDENDGNKAIGLAEDAMNSYELSDMVNNYAVVLFMRDQIDLAIAVLEAEVEKLDRDYTSFLNTTTLFPEAKGKLVMVQDYIKKNQLLNEGYVYESFTPMLNLALMFNYKGNKNKASDIAGKYFNKYEISSLWAKFLSEKTGAVLPKPPVKEYMAVKGVKVGDSVGTVTSAWGQPTEIAIDQNKNELWFYKSYQTILRMDGGTVWQMDIIGKPSPLVNNKFGIGSRRADIEKIFGPCKQISDSYYIYEGKQNIAVQYVQNVAITIALFP